jgi:hypothetical protein
MTAVGSKASEEVPRRLRPRGRWTRRNAQPTSFGRNFGRGSASRVYEVCTLLKRQLAESFDVGTGRLLVRSNLAFN